MRSLSARFPTRPSSENPTISSAVNSPLAAVLLETVVCDQLDDVPGRIEEVDGARVPVLELEDAAEELEPLVRPGVSGVEAVAGDEEREVVEGLAFARRRTEASSPPVIPS